MKITGHVICYDNLDDCEIDGDVSRSAILLCEDEQDQFLSIAKVVNQTTWTTSDATFIQGQMLEANNGLGKVFLNSSLKGWNLVDGTYIDGTYTEPRLYDPIQINYGIHHLYDNTHWRQLGFRFREPGHDRIGYYYTNMTCPDTLGTHRIEWIYKKDQSSFTAIDNQTFQIVPWGNQPVLPSDTSTGYPINLTIETKPNNQTLNIGDTAMFTLVVTGILPAPLTYLWRFNGNNLTDGGKFSGTDTNTITISDITENETGIYNCVVSDRMLSTESWLFINQNV